MAVTINGSTGIEYDDNVKLILGSGDDLEAYHDGTESFIHNNTDDLNIEGDSIKLRAHNGEAYITCAANGAVGLRYDNTERLATTSAGATLSGRLLASSTAHDPDNGAFDAANYPLVVQNPEDTNADSTGIGFAVTTATDKVGAAIHHIREGGGSKGDMRFLVSSDGNSITERLRIRSDGNILIAMQDFSSTPSASNYGIALNNTNAASVWAAGSATTNTHIIWANTNGTCGTIQTEGTGTSYNTSSDYRLKENIVGITDGITRLKQLAPKRFNFKTNTSKVLDGFLAHEVTPIVPEAISGEKDAVITQAMVDNKEYEKDRLGEILPQGIDQAKLVPLLTAALQEAITEIETLKTKVAALEAA